MQHSDYKKFSNKVELQSPPFRSPSILHLLEMIYDIYDFSSLVTISCEGPGRLSCEQVGKGHRSCAGGSVCVRVSTLI